MVDGAIIAKRYAIAFLNVFGKSITETDFKAIKQARDFLSRHKRALFLFTLPHIKDDKKLTALDQVINDEFGLPDSFNKLFALLLADKRIFLLYEVFVALCEVYKKYNGIAVFTFYSSHTLTKAEQEIMKQFLASQTKLNIMYTCTLDSSLIAGIRLQSTNYLWEYSVKSQLTTFKLTRI